MSFARALFCLSLALSAPAWADGTCPPEGTDAASLQLLKQQKFVVEDAATRDALALGLLACLSSPDPELRDGIAFEALTAWLRGKQLSAEARRALRTRLYALLQGEDAAGFQRPFAALVLSEVARTDRIEPWMSPQERDAMVTRAADYVASVRDYRGFDNAPGWRHGVAHGSDWLMQLALNPALDRAQADRILAAVASQTVPESGHAYVFGEAGRLARPVLYVAQRGLLTSDEWINWFGALPPRLGDPAKAYADVAWLARRHDLLAFLTAIHLEAVESKDAQIQGLRVPAVMALKAVP
ncbi:MAG TPA: DUF2785 domain-containing protein [Pseudoxanthomonas sp.]